MDTTLEKTIPQAPGALPLLGHLPSFAMNPLKFLDTLPATGDLVRLRWGSQTVVMVCDPHLTREVLLDDRTFDKGGPLHAAITGEVPHGLVTCRHNVHRRQRRLCQPSFRNERLDGYSRAMIAEAYATADSWRAGQVVHIRRDIAELTLRTAVGAMFSAELPPATTRNLVHDTSSLVATFFRWSISPPLLRRLPTPGNLRFTKAINRLKGTVAGLIAARRAEGSAATDHGDLLSSMIGAGDSAPDGDAGFCDEELVDQVLQFFIAGGETTAGALVWSLDLIGRHPEIEERLLAEADAVVGGEPLEYRHVAELDLATRVVNEALRMYPPVWVMPRIVEADTELGGVLLPAGTMLAVSPYVVHQKPGLYEHPERFAPDRWLDAPKDRATFIPFGSGARSCIGGNFAMAESVLTLTALMARWKLVPISDKPPKPSVGTTLSGRGMRMKVLPREPRPTVTGVTATRPAASDEGTSGRAEGCPYH